MSLAYILRPYWHKACRAGIKKVPGSNWLASTAKNLLARMEDNGADYATIHDDLKIYLRNDPTHEIRFGYLQYIRRGEFEQPTADIFRSVLKPGGTVLDIGAAFGYFSLLGARLVGPTGRVYAFEPEPIGYANLCKNSELNGFTQTIMPHNLGLSDRAGLLPYFGAPCGGSIMPNYAKQFNATQAGEVQVRPLDEIMEGYGFPAVDLLKIDIEGGEINAYRGMRETLRRSPRLVIVSELAPPMLQANGQSVAEFFDELRSHGFTKFADVTRATRRPLSIPADIPRIERMEFGYEFLGVLDVLAER